MARSMRRGSGIGGSTGGWLPAILGLVVAILALCLAFRRQPAINNNQRVYVESEARSGSSGEWWGGTGWGWGPGIPDPLLNPYVAPFRLPFGPGPVVGIPINVPTAIGAVPGAEYRQIGILTAENAKARSVLPLMGRPVYVNRDKWNFYTLSENGVKLPIMRSGKSCSNEYGCDNIYTGDTVMVQGYDEVYVATVYETGAPGLSYLPIAV